MGDALDAELGDFINKLNGIQSKLGNAKARAGLVGDDGKVDRFSELKLNMSEKLSEIRQVNFHVLLIIKFLVCNMCVILWRFWRLAP